MRIGPTVQSARSTKITSGPRSTSRTFFSTASWRFTSDSCRTKGGKGQPPLLFGKYQCTLPRLAAEGSAAFPYNKEAKAKMEQKCQQSPSLQKQGHLRFPMIVCGACTRRCATDQRLRSGGAT